MIATTVLTLFVRMHIAHFYRHSRVSLLTRRVLHSIEPGQKKGSFLFLLTFFFFHTSQCQTPRISRSWVFP